MLSFVALKGINIIMYFKSLTSFTGHTEIVKTLINDFRKIRIDQKNRAGMTALIKAAIQGRTKCAKTLLYAGKYY